MKKLLFLLLFSSITYAQVYEKTTAVGLDSSVAKPSAVAKYGWVYRGTDNHLYWRTLNGTRMLDSSTSITIDSTNWQKYPDTLTWDATKKNLKDSTASLRTDLYRKDTHVTDSTNARNYSNSLYLKNADSTTLKNSINVAGTLSNVAYLNQVNRFSATQRLATGKGLLLSNATNAYHDGIVVSDSSIYFQTNITDTTLVAGGSNRAKINTLGLTTTHVLPFATNTFDLGTSSLYYRRLYTKDMTFYDGVGTAVPITSGDASLSIAGDINIGAYSYYNTLNLNGLAYWDAGYKIASIANVASGGLLMSNGTGANVPSYLPLGSSGTVLSSMAGQTVPTYNSKIFLYPSDSAFIVTSSIKNKNVASYVQQGDTSAYVMDFTTGTGKPQLRIKDPTGATTLYIDSTGQINGSEVANGDLTLQGTTHATRTTSYVNLQPNGGFVGIGTATPSTVLNITQPSTNDVTVTLTESATNRSTLFAFLPTGAQSPTNPQWTMGTLYNDAANGFHFSTYDGTNTRDRFSIDTASNMTFTGKVANFNNIATQGYGVPSIIDTVYRTLQTASIAAFNVANSAVAGLYEVRYYIECTATGTGNTTVTVDWDNATKSVTSTACSHSATTNFQQGTISIYHAATSSTSIRLSTTCTTTGTYALRAWVKRIN